MSEATVQAGLKTLILAMSEFSSGDVVINDWDVLDGEMAKSPFVIISEADNFIARRDTTTPNTKWEVKVTLYQEFKENWKDAYNSFRTNRQALIDTMNITDNRSADGISGVTIDEIRAGSPLQIWVDPGTPQELQSRVMPLFISQELLFDVEEY